MKIQRYRDSAQRHWPLLLATAALACGCGRPGRVSASAEVTVAPVVKVRRQDISSNLEIASEFQPFQEIEVYAKVSGYIQKVSVDWGTHVKQGQILATLEVPELQQQIEQDDAAVRRSEHELERSQADLNRATSSYKVSHLNYTRLAEVEKTQPGLVAQQDIDAAQGKDVEADAGVSGAREAQAAAEQALMGAKAALEKDKAMYNYTRIVAPFDGVVTQMGAYTGALLPAGTSSNKGDEALCRLSQNNVLRLVIPVPERAVPDVDMGETVAVKVSTLNRTFPGKIVRISGQIDTQTRTMHTEVEVPNPKYELVPGMYASVQVPIHHAAHVLALPTQAVQDAGPGKGTVLVIGSDNRVEKRGVDVGLRTATATEISSGVRDNELVIFGEQGQYQPGQVVSPKVIDPMGVQ